MTSPISSFSQAQGLANPSGPGSAAPRPKSPGAAPSAEAATPQGEAVTLTAGAQTSTQLLDAARAAAGIDNQTVQTLRAAIQADTYNVPPDQLATSIVAALTDIQV